MTFHNDVAHVTNITVLFTLLPSPKLNDLHFMLANITNNFVIAFMRVAVGHYSVYRNEVATGQNPVVLSMFSNSCHFCLGSATSEGTLSVNCGNKLIVSGAERCG